MATARRTAAAPVAARTPTRPPVGRRSAAPATSSGYTGDQAMAARERAEAEAAAAAEQRQQAANMPFRYFTPIGETREVVVVDATIRECFFRYEHTLQNPRSQKWDVHVACIKEHANCPVCSNTTRPAYFAMYLTVIDLTPFVTRDNEEVPWSKKLLVVKLQQQKKFIRIEERLIAQGLGLRGAILQLTRDSDKDATIGNEIEYVEHMSEEDMATYVSSYKDQNGRTHEVIGNEAFNYDELFPMPSEQMLRAVVGGRAAEGTREGDDRNIGRAANSSRRAPERPAADDWEGGQRGAAPAVRRPVRGARPAAEEPEGEVEDVQPRAPARRVIRGTAPAPAPVTSRAAPARRAPVDTPPPRASLADRRAALRGNR